MRVLLTYVLMIMAYGIISDQSLMAQEAQPMRPLPDLGLPASVTQHGLSVETYNRYRDDLMQLISEAAPDQDKVANTTQAVVLSVPRTVSKIISAAEAAPTSDQTASLGLGVCMATASLFNAANQAPANSAEASAARNLGFSILSSVTAALQVNASLNGAFTNSFGISTGANGGVTITCIRQSGEVVATTAVSAPNAAVAGGGVGAPTASTSSGFFAAAADSAGGGGSLNKVAFIAGQAALLFNAQTQNTTTSTPPTPVSPTGPGLPVPGPQMGTGLMGLVALTGLVGFHRLGGKMLFVQSVKHCAAVVFKRKPHGLAPVCDEKSQGKNTVWTKI